MQQKTTLALFFQLLVEYLKYCQIKHSFIKIEIHLAHGWIYNNSWAMDGERE
jgi:hypothetical protein